MKFRSASAAVGLVVCVGVLGACGEGDDDVSNPDDIRTARTPDEQITTCEQAEATYDAATRWHDTVVEAQRTGQSAQSADDRIEEARSHVERADNRGVALGCPGFPAS